MTSGSGLWSSIYGDHETSIDIYRHGKYPNAQGDVFAKGGGKIAFNVLYCDGHVATCVHGGDAYRATRMKFPG
jgi:prepilin-type processing-associated H-X9-DG protein